jgi:transposase-like protein
VSTVCRELRDRYRAFRARSLAEVRLLALFMDAIYLPVRPDGPKEGVLAALDAAAPSHHRCPRSHRRPHHR